MGSCFEYGNESSGVIKYTFRPSEEWFCCVVFNLAASENWAACIVLAHPRP